MIKHFFNFSKVFKKNQKNWNKFTEGVNGKSKNFSLYSSLVMKTLSQVNQEENSDDEVIELNKLIKQNFENKTTHTNSNKQKSKNNMGDLQDDPFKEVLSQNKKSKYQHPSIKKENEEERMQNKIKKMSLSEQATIRKDEDVTRYNLVVQNDKDVDSLIDDIFTKGVNTKFYKKIDKIFKAIENESIVKEEKETKVDNIEELTIVDKDISDIEEEIEKEGVENLFMAKIAAQENISPNKGNNKKVSRTIEEYMEIDKKEMKMEKEKKDEDKFFSPAKIVPSNLDKESQVKVEVERKIKPLIIQEEAENKNGSTFELKNPFEDLQLYYPHLLKFHNLPVFISANNKKEPQTQNNTSFPFYNKDYSSLPPNKNLDSYLGS